MAKTILADIRKTPKRHALAEAARSAQALYETNVADLDPEDIACRAGCGGCCHSHVGIEPAEAFAILQYLQANRTEAETAALFPRVRQVAQQVADLNPGSRWAKQIPCAFLEPDAGTCGIYAARPLACRGYNSLDVEACHLSRLTLDHAVKMPADGERMGRANTLRHALADATARLLNLRQTPDHRELHQMLMDALESGSEMAWGKQMKQRARAGRL
ncbi:YkgJ family cysteine cluster protein [Magnetospira sp. QH-2]|uniref:YkgJ family cysteine cluster protein n=1 Tax=Magnetospira sp. (strain QH-2) TaxID=1288970 RepID=UPI0003E817E6|nr:YkgJ family cysteine cluster protein [Magnetospira sp. QH-2]CCQ73620.1 Protein of unknown function [Magnetospira sp. QH-2]